MDIFNTIQQSAHQYNIPDDFEGYGIPNFMAAHYILEGIPFTNDEDGDGEANIIKLGPTSLFPDIYLIVGNKMNPMQMYEEAGFRSVKYK